MGPAQIHFERLKRRFAEATMVELASGAGWCVRVPSVNLAAGWSKTTTCVLFVAPPAYPFANLDCFWTDADLRLANGAMPQNSQLNNPVPPGITEPLLWFSWHLKQPWNPNRDDFGTWMAVVQKRLAFAQ